MISIAGKSVRWKSFAAFFATSLASRGISISCQLVQVPIAIGAMGKEAFGLWMTLTSISYLVSFADFGMGVGVQNRLAESFAVQECDAARQLFGSAFLFLLAMAGLLAVMLLPLSWLLDLPRLFGLTEPRVISDAPSAVATILAIFCLGFPFGLAQRLAYAQQLGWKHNLSQACGSLVAVAALFITAKLRLGIGAMILCGAAPGMLANAGLLIHLLKQRGWLALRGFRADFNTVRQLLSLGVHFTVQQVLNTTVFALPPIIISTTLGAAAVTPFNLAQRFFNLFGVLQNAFMLPLWPAYSEAKAKGEFDWIRHTLRRSLLATTFFTVLPMAIGAWFARHLIHLWVREPSVIPSASLILLLFLWNASVFLQQPFAYLLAGISRVRRLTVFSIVSAVCATTLMFVLVRWHGQEGVVLGMLIGSVPLTVWCNVSESLKFLRTAGPMSGEPKASH